MTAADRVVWGIYRAVTSLVIIATPEVRRSRSKPGDGSVALPHPATAVRFVTEIGPAHANVTKKLSGTIAHNSTKTYAIFSKKENDLDQKRSQRLGGTKPGFDDLA